ncbi:MAG: hypothetical protein ABI718_11960 [Acidobacteriota bacterium]
MMGAVSGVALLVVLGAPGVAALRRLTYRQSPAATEQFTLTALEQFTYGMPLGVVVFTLILLAAASTFGLSTALVVFVAVIAAVTAGLLWPDRFPGSNARQTPDKNKTKKKSPRDPRSSNGAMQWTGSRIFAGVIFSAFVIRWAIFWRGALDYETDGLWSSDIGTWADWSLHIGDVSSFVFGNNFPPHDPHYTGVPYAYHYLVSVTAAAMVKAGMTVTGAMTLQSFLFSVLIAASIYCFARRMTGDRSASALTILFVLLGGGWGWTLTLSAMDRSHPLASFLEHLWNLQLQEKANFRWLNAYFALIEPQRAFLYGIPLALLIATLLFAAVRTKELKFYLAAGVIAGLLPFANLSALLALALVTPFLFFFFPAWRWMFFFGTWVAIAVPQLYLQQGGGVGAASAMRIQAGWIAAPDNWLWFWGKNLGLFLPVLIVAISWRSLFDSDRRRFLGAFMPAFVIANLVVFQPWDWDNTKVFVFWFIAASIFVSVAVMTCWRRYSTIAVRLGIVLGVLSFVLSGLLINLNQLLHHERFLLLSRDELELAEQVRMRTAPDAVFAVGLQNNHPVPVLGGRTVVMSYPGWLWSHGYDYAERERDLRELYALSPRSAEIVRKYGIVYLVVGPWERNEFHVNVEGFRERYPVAIATDDYDVYRVR